MRITGVLTFLAVLFAALPSFAQTPEIDRLKQELKRAEGEANYSKSIELATLYLERDASAALQVVETTLKDPSLGTYPRLFARAVYVKAKATATLGNYNQALLDYNEAYELSQQVNDRVLEGNILIDRGRSHARIGQYDAARKDFLEGTELMEIHGSDIDLANAFFHYGRYANTIEEYTTSLEFYSKSLEIYEALDDKKGISDLYYALAVLNLDLNDEDQALDYFSRGLAIKKEIDDLRGLADYSLSLGVLHEQKGNYRIALNYYHQSLKGYKEVGDQLAYARTLNNIGVAYVDMGNYDSAQYFHKESVKLHNSFGTPIGIIRSSANLGEVYQFQENYQQALGYYTRAKSVSESTDGQPLIGLIYDNLGLIHLKTNSLDSASYYLYKSRDLKLEKDDYFPLRHTYEYLSLLSEKEGDLARALDYYKLHKEVADSLMSTRRARELAEVHAKYETERQEQEIISLQQENEQRTLWRNIFAVGSTLAIIFALLVFQFFVYRHRKNKQLLLAEEAQREQLERLDRLKSRFFGNISHEFRTPLTLILGPLDKIRQHVDQGLQPTVDVIERNGKRLLKLINQLLDLSRIESGKVTLKTAYQDVVPVIKGWVMSFNSIAETKGIQLRLNSPKESHYLYVDRAKLEEVIINLLSNAFKFTPEGGRITVELHEKHVEAQDFLSITVTDTGRGIPGPELEHIFNRFYQASNTAADDITGTGIGLALIKELVELHQGSVQVESEVGKGSVFEVLLPFGKAHLKEEEIADISQPAAPEIQPEVLPPLPETTDTAAEAEDDTLPLVLIVEDNQDLRTYIRDILQEAYKVLEAVDGEMGLAMAREEVPDIILSDLMMPKMDGLQLCKILKGDMSTSHIPVILLTARSSKEDKLEGLQSLADDYITKPFDTEELLARLQNLIQLRKKMQAYFGSGDSLLPKSVKMNSMDTLFMEKVTEKLEEEISNPLFGVEELAGSVGLSRSQLFRKIKAITNLTPNEFIRSFRLYRAMDLLKQRSAPVSEIAYETGFQNPSYFSKRFQDQFGITPSAVARQNEA